MSDLQSKILNASPKHAAIVGLLLAGLYYVNYFDGGAKVEKQITAKKVELATANKELQDVETLVGDYDSYQKDIAQLSEVFEEALKFLPSRENIYVVIRQLHLEARKSGVNITVVKPSDTRIQQEFYEELPFTIEARGGYIPIVTFLSKIASLSRIINLKNIKLVGDSNNAVIPLVTLTGTMHAYRFKDKSEAAAVPPQGAGVKK